MKKLFISHISSKVFKHPALRQGVLMILCIFITVVSHAQKPPVDFKAIDSWSFIGDGAISGNGQYVLYYTYKGSFGNKALDIVSAGNNWKKEIAGGNDALFTEDSKKVVFKTPGDSLCVLTLGGDKAEFVPDIQSFKLFVEGKSEYLLYQLHNNDLVFRDMAKGNITTFSNVERYQISENDQSLLLQSAKDKEGTQTLKLVALPQGSAREIWKGKGASGYLFDQSGNNLAFTVTRQDNNSIWLYRTGTAEAVELANNLSDGIDKGYQITSIDHFTPDGSSLVFKVREPDFPKPKKDAVMLDVWSYLDPVLQSRQLHDVKANPPWYSGGPQSYVFAVNTGDHKIIRLQKDKEMINMIKGDKDEYAFISYIKNNSGGGYGGEKWSKDDVPEYYLASVRDGLRKKLPMQVSFSGASMSPDGKYLTLISDDERDLYSYEINTGKVRNLTGPLPIPLDFYGKDKGSDWHYRKLKVVGWVDDGTVLIDDQFDIWQIDPSGKRRSFCLTNGYGLKNKIVFRLLRETELSSLDGKKKATLKKGSRLLLCAFNLKNEENGFYRLTLGEQRNPEKLTMAPYRYYVKGVDAAEGMRPIKAKDKDVWLVSRQSASESPNLFYTNDFIHFTQLSHVYPEKKYNWLTSEVRTFETLDGRQELGVLYKPENFDSTKKYPVIIHYYEQLAQHAYDYKRPEPTEDNMNIPWFVSHGYMVFTPDIHYTFGQPGESIMNTMLGLVKYLKQFNWIDGNHMGIQGQSYGGFETNYIVTHTNVFAAAMASSGFADLVSGYGEVTFGEGDPFFASWVNGQGRLGATLWQRPDLYIKYSPLFNADKVTTPLLMMNNREDGIVNFSQGIEFFTALRRLGKKVWMLQYDGEGHGIINDNAGRQHTIRLTQFFDHYLKGWPAPKWMVGGIPAKMKGIDDGLELESAGVEPGPSLLTDEERKKVAQYSKVPLSEKLKRHADSKLP